MIRVRSASRLAIIRLKECLINRLAFLRVFPRPLRPLLLSVGGHQVSTRSIYSETTLLGTKLRVGSFTFINRQCFLDSEGGITIGSHCRIGMQVMILTSTHAVQNDKTFSEKAVYRPVVIGDRVWLGARSIINPGVKIGSDVIIASGSVVSSDCRRPGLYAGVPAKLIRGRDV